MLIFGIVLTVSFGILLADSFKATPTNLKGYYGKYFIWFAVLGLISGILLILSCI
jgi:hypothetical protein